MKKLITLLLVLLACLKLSAPAYAQDTTKQSTPDQPGDTLKLAELVKKADSLTLPVTAMNKERVPQPENLNISAPVYHSYSVRLSASVHHNDSLFVVRKIKSRDSLKAIALAIHMDSLKFQLYAHLNDSLKKQIRSMSLDSLKQQLRLNKNDMLAGTYYAEIATRYLDYDTISNKKIRLSYQLEAINFTMRALHRYSHYNDTIGLRNCFDNLAKVYSAQKKYSQAKWFILQSNTLSRVRKDTPNIITSLLTLAAIKTSIKDYTLAMRDLNEALQLSITSKHPKVELDVLKSFALLYSRMKNYTKEALVLKKRDSLEASIRLDEEGRLLARVAARDSLRAKKLDSLQNKKKVYSFNIKKLSKGSSVKKTTSL